MTPREIMIVAAMAVITFGIRYAFFALGERARFPPLLRRALHYVPVAVLTAIVVPMVLMPDNGGLALTWRNPWLLGVLASGLIAWRWNHLLTAIAVGMAVFFAAGWLL